MGRVAYNQGDHYHVILWMQEALNRAYHEKTPTAQESDILEYLAFSMYQQGNIRRAIKLTKRLAHLGKIAKSIDWARRSLFGQLKKSFQVNLII